MDSQLDVCADCTAPSPQWASVNRGVLLCDDCSSIHRQLGRHISQVIHLRKSRWRPSQLEMIHYLVTAGANRYWEHVLYEPMLTGRQSASAGTDKERSMSTKKPKPSDPVHPTKAEFIREKYLFLGFFKKPRNVNHDDLNQQLHASVRTGVLETTLYLLTLGANPNFVHPSKGTAPLHVACQYGQLGQVEMLLAYGADVCIRDCQGHTPIDVALDRALAAAETAGLVGSNLLTAGQKLRFAWSPLVDVLVNAYYEVTDGLAYFLCRSVPDHKAAVLGLSMSNSPMTPPMRSNSLKNGTRTLGHTNVAPSSPSPTLVNGHFLICTTLLKNANAGHGDHESTVDDWMNKARCKLQQLPNLAFEDLCIDVYDEADRRFTNTFLEGLDPSISEHKLNGLSLDNSTRGVQGTEALQSHKCVTPSATMGTAASGSAPHGNRSLTLYFLPPNTAYSSVRNQARQKLGRLSTVEFHTLVLDILTEVSARLLPLFPPTSARMSRSVNSDVSQRQPYSTYFPAQDIPKELMPTSVSTRLTPLPSPPLIDTFVDSDIPLDSHTEPTSPVTNISSSTSICEADVKIHRASTSLVKPNNASGPKKHTENGKTRARCDDPVYDQVAAESDVSLLIHHNGLLLPSSPTVPVTPPSTESLKTGLKAASDELIVDTNMPINLPSGASLSVTHTDQVPSPNITDASIICSPGAVPGSRRLHLSHTGRMGQHRASVPSAHAPSSKPINDYTLSPVLEAVNLATEVTGSLASARGTTIQAPRETLTAQLKRRDPTEPCCVAAKNEVDRLRKENADLRTQLSESQSFNKVLEKRIQTLEERVQLADALIESLGEEKSTLLAAISAGMVMTHSPTSQSSTTTSHPICNKITNVNTATETDTKNEIQSASNPSDLTESEVPASTVEEYANDDEVDYEDRPSESSNYSVGLQCTDSGMLLRQGIIMRSGVVRGGSPASSKPVGTSSVANQHRTTAESTASIGMSITSYVNVPQLQPRPVPKPMMPVTCGTHVRPVMTTSHVLTTHSDYVAPNSTGSASPPPILSSSTSPAPSNLVRAVTTVSYSNPASSERFLQSPQQVLQKQHAQILASIATLPDYDTPAHEPDAVQSRSTMSNSKMMLSSGVSTIWNGPSSDQVVRCVEAIIVRIRNLVQLANGERTGDLIDCSLLIESAVQDILSLFPSPNTCPTDVSGALSDLASASLTLRSHCEHMSRNLNATGLAQQRQVSAVSQSFGPEVNVLIRHAHKIAKAAKQLLSIFQRV